MQRGILLLAGGSEFQGKMANVDRAALGYTQKESPRVGIIPTAAVPDNNHQAAGANAVRWFQTLGVADVAVIPILDRQSADDPYLCRTLAGYDFVYMLGGFPHYLAQALMNSRCMETLIEIWRNGSSIAGSSAGAMVCCRCYLNSLDNCIYRGLGLVENVIVIPHYEKYGKIWKDRLAGLTGELIIMGIDEQTGVILRNDLEYWQVYGKGWVTLVAKDSEEKYCSGQNFSGRSCGAECSL